MTNLAHTTRSLYQTAMRILNQQPQWVNPDMSADFTDHTITIAQGHTQYKIQFDETHGLLIDHDYLTIYQGRDCLSLNAFAILGNISPERFRQGFHYYPATNEFEMDDDLKQDITRGAQELMAKHDTTNMLDILCLEAQQHEANKEKL